MRWVLTDILSSSMIRDRIQKTKTYQKFKIFLEENERILVPGSLIAGFIFDIVTFKSLSISSTFIVSGIYVLIVAAAMVAMAVKQGSGWKVVRYFELLSPLILQFALGSLFSTSFLFYWYSGSLSASWPILLVLVVLMISNEVFRHYFLRPTVQIGILFFVLFSQAAILSAYAFNSLEPSAFVIGGTISLAIMSIFLFYFTKIPVIKKIQKRINIIIAAIFISMNALYFLNVIPPIPLSLRDAGMYHDIQSHGGGYNLVGEEESWIDKLLPGQIVHLRSSDKLFAFTSIFAPAELETTIVHKWQRYDKDTHRWVTNDTLSFYFVGGREDGYRGYTFKTRMTEGKWRVSVETARGQILGRIPFTVDIIE